MSIRYLAVAYVLFALLAGSAAQNPPMQLPLPALPDIHKPEPTPLPGQRPAEIHKMPAFHKLPSDPEEIAEKKGTLDFSGPWRILQKTDHQTSAFALGDWAELKAGKYTRKDFQPFSPPDIHAALGLGTVYGPDTAGWCVSLGRRLHVRTTNKDRNNVTLSYESLARMAWGVGVTRKADPSVRLLYKNDAEPSLFSPYIKQCIQHAPDTGVWLVASLARCPIVEGQALARAPVEGTALNNIYDPTVNERSYFSPIQRENQWVIAVSLVVDPYSKAPLAREARLRFFPPDAEPSLEHLFIRTHYAVMLPPLPQINPGLPVQDIWEVPLAQESILMPKVASVRELLPATSVAEAYTTIYAIDQFQPYDLYEIPVLVDLAKMDPSILIEQKWATDDTFVGQAIYEKPRVLLRKPVADLLVQIHEEIKKQGLRFKIFDGYRPLSVTQRLYLLHPGTPYLAVPNKGSRHNRGAAVDITLVQLNGDPLQMPSDYLTFDERARRDYKYVTEEHAKNRDLLTQIMTDAGFSTIKAEWWHYDAPNWAQYPVLDVPLWPTGAPEEDPVIIANAEDGLAPAAIRHKTRKAETSPSLPNASEETTSIPFSLPEPTVKQPTTQPEKPDASIAEPSFRPLPGAVPTPERATPEVIPEQKTNTPPQWFERLFSFLSQNNRQMIWQQKILIFLVFLTLFLFAMYIKSRI